MTRTLTTFASLLLALLQTACTTPSSSPNPDPQGLAYPITPTTNVIDTFFGTRIPDPFRWLEDNHAPTTRAWIHAQNDLTFAYLDQIPERPRIRARLAQLWNYERYGVPFKRGTRYFFTRNDGLQNQNVLYRLDHLDADPVVLLDPNLISPDGSLALTGFTVTEDGATLAYGIAHAGSDWQEWRLRDVTTGKDLPDIIRRVKFSSASWSRDGQGFFYSRYDDPVPDHSPSIADYHHKLYYHQLGTAQDQDRLVYHRPDQKEWGFYGRVTDDGRFLIINVSHGTDTRNRVFYLDLEQPDAQVVELLNNFDAAYDFVGNVERLFYFRTNLDAPLGRIITINLAQPHPDHWQTIIPQSTYRLLGANLINRQLITFNLQDASSRIHVFDLDGNPLRPVPLPALGTTTGFGGRIHDTETFFAFTSFTTPGTIYHHDLRTGQQTLFRQPTLQFNPNDYVTRQVFCRSKDGTRVPLFLSHRKDLPLDGRNPAYLLGYGGFDISLTPAFSVACLAWMELGGVYAVANTRGGGEYGEAWHQAGMKHNKQNTFDDFIAAAEWLILNNYSSHSSLAIGGGSNGGLLVGACMTQRPGLFAAALPSSGVMDMLRFHKFTIGWAWTSEYGSPENSEDFPHLFAYSPLHNLQPGTAYPATLITTADRDDRVVPAHSFKFAAALQHAHTGPAPVLIRIETPTGFGAGQPVTQFIDESADRWAFLVRHLNVTLPASYP
jgi:prolyl oligopeptidase